jgi:uncharacterized protein (DUF427 family)
MSLTLGSIAPLGRPTGGRLNFGIPDQPAHLLYHHELPQRIRGLVAGETVVDTTAATMLHETRMLPRWYLPRTDVRTDLLVSSETTSHCPFKGDAIYWHVRVGDTVIDDAFWEYPEPLAEMSSLAGLLSPYVEKFDRWLEEDEEVHGHPKDPFHRVDVRRSSRQVTVRAAGEVVATTTRALALHETGFPTRWYLRPEDLSEVTLTPTDTATVCPYKGTASYWTLTAGDRSWPDAMWSYLTPNPQVHAIGGYVSILADDLEVTAT